jgi:hypothetical protein
MISKLLHYLYRYQKYNCKKLQAHRTKTETNEEREDGRETKHERQKWELRHIRKPLSIQLEQKSSILTLYSKETYV